MSIKEEVVPPQRNRVDLLASESCLKGLSLLRCWVCIVLQRVSANRQAPELKRSDVISRLEPRLYPLDTFDNDTVGSVVH